MTEVLHSPSHFPSSSSSLSYAPTSNNGGCLSNQIQKQSQSLINNPSPRSSPIVEDDLVTDEDREPRERDKEGDHLPLLALLLTAFRKSLAACRTERKELCSMEISWPTNVRHVAHVTFDRFDGFLGLPVEFEPEVPRRAPSASANVFGVSTESMQLSYDSRGNSVPTILLLMQKRLYSQEGLQAEGIFRINAENSQEENVRDQLNQGVVPDGIDVHCLAGLIKAWFRELPSGVLDTLTPEQVMRCESEEECTQLVKLLPSTEAALLDWVVNLMADVVQEEHLNKMSARNIAMVFAPNMTQMADPLTALMYAVQVMNFLKMLILRTLKERQDSVLESASSTHIEPSDENGHHSSSQPCLEASAHDNKGTNLVFVSDEPRLKSSPNFAEDHSTIDIKTHGFQSSIEKVIQNENGSIFYDGSSKAPMQDDIFLNEERGLVNDLKSSGISVVSHINSRAEQVEAWR